MQETRSRARAEERTWTILPFDFLRDGMALVCIRNAPRVLMFTLKSKLETSIASAAPPFNTPALLTRQSIRPKESSVNLTTAAHDSSDATSSLKGFASPPASEICLHTASRTSVLRAAAMIRYPRLANRIAAALPIPEEAPVTMHTFFGASDDIVAGVVANLRSRVLRMSMQMGNPELLLISLENEMRNRRKKLGPLIAHQRRHGLSINPPTKLVRHCSLRSLCSVFVPGMGLSMTSHTVTALHTAVAPSIPDPTSNSI